MSEILEIKLPRARIIYGHPMKLKGKINYNTGQPDIDEKTGLQKQICIFHLAVPKTDPALYGPDGVFAKFAAAAGRAWPENPDNDSEYKWKVSNGDGTRLDKKKNQQVEYSDYCKGHWIIKVTSHGWVANCVYQPGPGQPHQDIIEPSAIKCGDYVDVILKVESNKLAGTMAGVFVNPGLVRFNEAGGAINTGGGMGASDADAAFGDSPAAPAGPPAAPAGPPAAPAGPPAAPAGPPAAPAGPPAAPAGPVKQMLPAAAGVTYDQYVALGWSDQQLIDGGLLMPPSNFAAGPSAQTV